MVDAFAGEVLYSRTCLVTKGGEVLCRVGGESDLGSRRAPGGTGFASVSVGNMHACGVTLEGKAYCWGWNGYGQLGDGAYGLLGDGSFASSEILVKVSGQR
jgi:alpha-tubulin suppressor-like RCC1 family protein